MEKSAQENKEKIRQTPREKNKRCLPQQPSTMKQLRPLHPHLMPLRRPHNQPRLASLFPRLSLDRLHLPRTCLTSTHHLQMIMPHCLPIAPTLRKGCALLRQYLPRLRSSILRPTSLRNQPRLTQQSSQEIFPNTLIFQFQSHKTDTRFPKYCVTKWPLTIPLLGT